MRTRQFAASPTVQAVIARALYGAAAPEHAARRWGAASEAAARVNRAGVSALEATDLGMRSPDSQLFGSFFDALPFAQGAWRRVGFHRRLLRVTGKAIGTWVGQSKAIPASLPQISPSSLQPRKVGALSVQTLEAFKDPLAEPLIENELRAAAVGAVVQALLDPANGGDDETPASLTHSSVATQISGTAEPGDDIAAAIAAFGGNLREAIFLLDPVTAVQLALARDAAGNFAFPAIGARGGSIAGIPAYVFHDAPRDTSGGVIALVDPSGVAYALDALQFERSTQATLEADSAPTGASDTPAAATAHVISLFQADLIAHKVIVECNWEAQRPGSAVAIIDADYPTGTT